MSSLSCRSIVVTWAAMVAIIHLEQSFKISQFLNLLKISVEFLYKSQGKFITLNPWNPH